MLAELQETIRRATETAEAFRAKKGATTSGKTPDAAVPGSSTPDPVNPDPTPPEPKKTEKQKRIEFLDKQYNPDNPDFTTPKIDPATPDTTPIAEPEPVTAKKEEPKEPKRPTAKEPAPETPEGEVKKFITEFKLETFIGPEFNDLNEAQKFKVVQDLKKRIVDIVKSEAQTQYSKDIKQRNVFEKIRASLNKELEIKNFESKAFTAIRGTDEGKKLITENLILLTEETKGKEISINNNKPEIVFITPEETWNETEKLAAINFNTAANKFREMPYEWGQENKGFGMVIMGKRMGETHRKEYEKAKAEYEKNRNEILTIEKSKELPGEEGKAILRLLQTDSTVQMEQLLNTHPEFEAEMNRFSKSEAFRAQGKDVWNMVGGKGTVNKMIFVGGYATRALTVSALGAVAAPVVGAVIGGIRGRFRAKDTLEGRQREARHGQKDESKERVVTTDAVHLTRRLREVMEKATKAPNEATAKKIFSELLVRLEHTQGKMEKGQVNFGNAKESLVNQFELINILNKALVVKESLPEYADADIKNRIERLLTAQGGNIAEKTSAAQYEFIKKQIKTGAKIGAGAATAGYVLRYFGELMGWWGHQGVPSHGHDVNLPNNSHDVHLPAEKDPFSTSMVDEKGHFKSPFGIRPDEVRAGGTPETIDINPDAVVQKNEGIEHALIRQIMGNEELAKSLGYEGPTGDKSALQEFAGKEAHRVALNNGYVDGSTGEEIRVKIPGQVAYQLKADGSVDEIRVQGGWVENHGKGTSFEGDQKESYEYRDRAHSGGKIATEETGDEKPSDSFTKLHEGKHPYRGIFEHSHAEEAPEAAEDVPEINQSQQAALEKLGYTGDPRDAKAVAEFFANQQKGGTADLTPTETPVRPDVEAATENVRSSYGRIETETPQRIRGGVNMNWGPAHQPPYENFGQRQSGVNTIWHSSGGRQGWWGGSSKAEIIANKYGTGLRINNSLGQNMGMGAEFYPDLSQSDNLTLLSHPSFAQNPYHLDGQSLLEVYKVSQNNLRHVFQPDVLERWNSFKLLKAKDVFADKNFETDRDWKYMYRHLGKLYEESGLKPKGGGLFRKAETLEHYIARASQKILAARGSLASITFERR